MECGARSTKLTAGGSARSKTSNCHNKRVADFAAVASLVIRHERSRVTFGPELPGVVRRLGASVCRLRAMWRH